MNPSNITFASNIYVIEGESKLSDKKFLSKVIDPGAIREIAKRMPKDAYGRVLFPLPLLGEIYENSTPCAFSQGDYSHGVILENGVPVFVNTCENEGCREFVNCSTAANYRKIVRTEQITAGSAPQESEPDDDFGFDIDLPVKPRESRAQKLRLRKTRRREVVEEIRTDVHIKEYKRWGVRGFWRRLRDGSTTWVSAHLRHHEREEVESAHFVTKTVPLKYRFKDAAQLEKFRRILWESKRRAGRLFPEAALAQSNTYQLKKIKQIGSAEKIIQSPLGSRILVNAGPGTGKTHTVIERLKYIDVNEEDVLPDSVLVLCFSRSAVKVIRDRLSEAIDRGEISPYAKRFTVMTFDSFATWYLMQTEPRRNLSCNSYDERIGMFIYEFERDKRKLRESLSYLIVDEIQDLVGVRAEMVRSLLKNLECGFLLLGDECQAIYDYRITDASELNAAKLYEWLEKSFDGLEEYELTRDWRHTASLGEKFAPLRSSMLYRPFNIQKEELLKVLDGFDVSDSSVEEAIRRHRGKGKIAVLSWSNGDAYRQSQDLYGSGVRHTLLTGARRLCFRRELAAVLCGYIQRTIDRRTFLRLAAEQGIDGETAKTLWAGILFTADREDGDDVPMEVLRRALLSERQVDEALVSASDADVSISTIHKAKGREFDTVLLNQRGDIDGSDGIKVYYVALTRAKKELIVRRSRGRYGWDLQTDRGRYIEVKGRRLKRIELGIDGDIDPAGFVAKSLAGMDAAARQRYIRDNVKIGDAVKISRQRGEYLIVHDGHVIGRLNKGALSMGSDRERRRLGFDDFTDFVELFVRDVVTVVNNAIDPDIAEPYNQSGFWYGIEFCGYAKPLEE